MADDLIPNQIITLVTIIGGLLCIYGTNISILGGVLAIVASILAAVLGTNTLRHVGKYSLGTGVPSIVYMLTAVALVSYLTGIVVSLYLNQTWIFPLISLIIAAIISLTVSEICKHIFNIQIEILSKSFISIAVASLLLMMSMSTLVAKSYEPSLIIDNVINNGMIIFIMIASVMVIQNPYNACMGPNEDQYRTLSLSVANGFLMLVILSAISLLTTEYWIYYMIISVIGWFIFFRKYVLYTKHQAASIRRYGLWPIDDGDD